MDEASVTGALLLEAALTSLWGSCRGSLLVWIQKQRGSNWDEGCRWL